MKTSTLMLLGGAAILAAVAFSKPTAAATGEWESGGGGTTAGVGSLFASAPTTQKAAPTVAKISPPTAPVAQKAIEVVSINPASNMVTTVAAATIPAAVQAVNNAVSSGGLLQPTSKTIATNVTAVVGNKTYTGNVAILGSTSPVTAPTYVGVAQPDRIEGLSNFDRLILQRKGLALTVENAKAQGLL